MLDSIIAERYAKSLFELAIETGKLEQVRKDMDLMVDVCLNNRDFRQMLISPVIRPDKKIAVMDAVFTGKIEELSKQFYHLLSQKRREKYLEAIAKQFIAKYKTYHNIHVIEIRSATPLSKELRERIIDIIEDRTKGTVELIEFIDKSLIGGFIVSDEGRRYDASLTTTIKKLKKEFEENLYIREL
jgi:F-type H+-transporting ATPase subunit delta